NQDQEQSTTSTVTQVAQKSQEDTNCCFMSQDLIVKTVEETPLLTPELISSKLLFRPEPSPTSTERSWLDDLDKSLQEQVYHSEVLEYEVVARWVAC
ncbi:hypothetical protein EVAR_65368_1, partial [Eumeta japonica]